MKRCPLCQSPLEEGRSFCKECEEERFGKGGWNRGGLRLKLAAAALFLLFLAAAALFFLGRSEGPASLVRGQIKSLQAREIAKAYYDYTSSGYRSETSLRRFREQLKEHPSWICHRSLHLFGERVEGDRASLNCAITTEEGSRIPVAYEFIKEDGAWKISAVQFIGSASLDRTLALREETGRPGSQEASSVVSKQLSALKLGKISEAYFNLTSKEFQQAMSYEAFEDFVSRHPVLTSHDSAHVEGAGADEEGRVRVQALLFSGGEEHPIDYLVVSEGGEARIWGLQAASPDQASGSLGLAKERDLDQLVREQLAALKRDDLIQAYYSFVSDDFKQATSLKEFQTFVKNYPELTGFTSLELIGSSEEEGLQRLKFSFTTSKGVSEIDYWFVEEKGTWKIWGIHVVDSAYYPKIEQQEMKQLIPVIDQHLEALRRRDLFQAYYAFVSSDFEEETSFEEFQDFVERHPVLFEFQERKILQGTSDGAIQAVRVELISGERAAEAEFRLVEEGGYWKIWGIQLIGEEAQASKSREALVEVIRKELEAIKEGDFSQAYWAYTSRKFQESLSQRELVEFLEAHSELSQYESLEVGEVSFKGNLAVVETRFTLPDRSVKSYEWRLVFENKRWKILSLQLISS